jgi:aldose 1-epimerase
VRLIGQAIFERSDTGAVPVTESHVDASGEQVVLKAGDLALQVVTVGGGMRELTVGDWHVLDGYGPDEVAFGAQGQVLVPWPNRLSEGMYEFEGNEYHLPWTEPAKRNAVHGFARWERWTVARRDETNAALEIVLAPRAGYPFTLGVEVEYRVSATSVGVTITGRNLGRSPLPYANGFHPYFAVGTPHIDDCLLGLPAATRLTVDERQIPTGREAVHGTGYDFRSPRPIGTMHLDTPYTDIARDAAGVGRITLTKADRSRSVTVRLGEAYRYLMAYTGDTLGDAARRRRSLALEPMTAAPNAFRNHDGLVTLQPGEQHVAEWGIEVQAG